jgi:hypothetical protein
MPEIKNPPCAIAAPESRTEHNVRLANQNRFDHSQILGGIVFQIRILNDHDVRGCLRNAGAQGSSLALVHLVPYEFDPRFHLP